LNGTKFVSFEEHVGKTFQIQSRQTGNHRKLHFTVKKVRGKMLEENKLCKKSPIRRTDAKIKNVGKYSKTEVIYNMFKNNLQS
jgi:hypothetical protein